MKTGETKGGFIFIFECIVSKSQHNSIYAKIGI